MSGRRKWQKVSSKELYRDNYFWLTRDDVIQPDGKPSKYGVYHTHGAIFIVARASDGRYIFVQQDRYPIGQETIEIVAGGLPEDADPLEHAKVELKEEVGAEAKKVELLGFLWAAPPRLTTKIHVALATDIDVASLHHGHQEGNEAINEILLVSEADVVKMIARGTLNDNATLASLNLYWSKFGYPQ